MTPANIPPEIKDQARQMQRVGWIDFWLQAIALFIAVLCLIFAITGRQFAEDANPAIGWGIFFAIFTILSGLVGAFLSVRYAGMGQRLIDPKLTPNPKKSKAVRLLKWGVYVGAIGTLLALIGCGLTSAVLLAKTVSQPPGTTLTDASEAVRAMDVLVLLANLNGIVAHWVGSVAALWLLYHIRYAPE